jgi:3-hydroxyisobutyrate dehydrogenase-like beta-hydroxyacid dehydrogenase
MPAIDNEQFDQRVRWLRAKAKEARTAADDMQHSDARITMLHIAETYEKVAEQLEKTQL